MNAFFAPKWAFQAQALHSADDPHLAQGVHLRLLPSPILGLPVAPFQIYRANLGQEARKGKVRSQLTWIDARGVTRTPPFKVTPDNPVTGWLPEDTRCCWIDVDAVPERIGPVFEPVPPVAPVPRPPVFNRPVLNVPSINRSVLNQPASRAVNLNRRLDLDSLQNIPVERLGRFATMQVDAVVDTPRGEAVLASRDRNPYQLSASRIRRVVVSGRGEVRGARWLSDTVLLRGLEFWRELSLPVAAAPRYAALPNAAALARDRVRRGAPRRFGLHDRPDMASAAAAPPASDADEVARLSPLINELQPCLDRLVNETTRPFKAINQTRTLVDEQSGKTGEFDVNCLETVLAGSLDPGIGRWLGFMEVDDQLSGVEPGDVMVYAIRGVWSIDPEEFGDTTGRIRMASLQNNRINPNLSTSAANQLTTDSLQPILERLENPGTLLDMLTLVCATIGHPPKLPAAPVLGEPSDREEQTAANGTRTAWIPQPIPDPARPPAPRREITTPLEGLVAGATLAVARRDDAGITGLNPKSPSGRAQSLVPGIVPAAEKAGVGVVCDRNAPGTNVRYRAAQADWFGRWSSWQERAAADGIPPRPPTPVINLTYERPSFDEDAIPTGPLAGAFQLRIAVPTLNELPPGARVLRTLQIDYKTATTPTGVAGATPQRLSRVVPDAFIHAAPDGERPDWVVSIPGPALPRCGQRTVEVIAQWVDTAGSESERSDPVRRTVHDPRPPEPLVLESPLLYAARPDAMGQARVELNWLANDRQQRFRVFYANQTRLMGKLAEAGTPAAQAILAELAAVSDPAAVADVFRAHTDYWPRAWFDQLTQEPVERNGSADMRYVHSVSGSLQVLSFYRIVSVSEANNESAFDAAPLLVYAVPNTGPPPQPKLRVTLARDPATQTLALPIRAQLTVEVPQGLVRAREYRLHRSILDGAELLSMPIAQTGLFPSDGAEATDTPQTVVIEDTGGLTMPPDSAPLKLWSTYFWRVVVRGEPESGSAAAGQEVTAPWSLPSVAVSASVIPPDPPLPVTNASATVIGAGVRLEWQHPEPLVGGRLGNYRFDLYRQLPGERLAYLTSLSADAAEADGGRRANRTGRFRLTDTSGPSGTRYRIVVVDPLERLSPLSDGDTVTVI